MRKIEDKLTGISSNYVPREIVFDEEGTPGFMYKGDFESLAEAMRTGGDYWHAFIHWFGGTHGIHVHLCDDNDSVVIGTTCDPSPVFTPTRNTY